MEAKKSFDELKKSDDPINLRILSMLDENIIELFSMKVEGPDSNLEIAEENTDLNNNLNVMSPRINNFQLISVKK
jgi:hypothetical protein